MKRSIHSYLLRLTAVAVAVCSMQPAMSVEEPKPLEASVSVGGGLIDGSASDKALYGQYNGLRSGSSYGTLSFDYDRFISASDQWVLVRGTNLLNDTRELNLLWRQPGLWRFSAELNQSVHVDPHTANTGLLGAGSSTPEVVRLNGGTGSGGDVDLKIKRTALGLGFATWFNTDTSLEIELKSEDKQGSRLFGVGMTCPSPIAPGCAGTTGTNAGWAVLMLPEPIRANHSQIEARLNYAVDKLRLSAGYYGSLYQNRFSAFSATVPGSLNNPLGDLLPLSTGLQALLSQPVALPPDNQAHQIDLMGHYEFNRTTRANFKLAYATATQRQDFAAAGFAGAPAGTPNLDGKVDTTTAKLGLSARPVPKLSLQADLRYEEKDDKTPLALYSVVDTASSTNRRLPSRKVAGKLQANWQFTPELRGTLAADYESIDRGVFTATSAVRGISALRQETDETGLRAELRRRLADNFSGAISVSRSQRDGSNWLKPNGGTGVTEVADPADPVTGFLPTALFMPTLADRRRDKARVFADWQPLENLTLQLSAEQGQDRFTTPSAYGLHSTRMGQLGVDWSYALSDSWTINGYVSQGVQRFNQSRFAGYVMAFDNTTTASGIGVAGKASGKLELGGQVSFIDDRSVYAQTLNTFAGADSAALLAATGGLPDVIFRQIAFKLFGRYALDKQSAVRVDLVYQRSKFTDWSWSADGLPFVYSDGTTLSQSPIQSVGVVGVSYIHQWR